MNSFVFFFGFVAGIIVTWLYAALIASTEDRNKRKRERKLFPENDEREIFNSDNSTRLKKFTSSDRFLAIIMMLLFLVSCSVRPPYASRTGCRQTQWMVGTH
jgi:hypothetical protein